MRQSKKLILLSLVISILLIEGFVRVSCHLKTGRVGWLTTSFRPKQLPVNDTELRTNAISKDGKIVYFKYKPGTNVYKSTYDGQEHTTHYYINKDGFRNKEIGPKDRYRIICFGGGWGIAGLESSDDETWPAQLDSLLGEDIEVINIGISGFSSEHIFNVLSMESYKYKPDLILLYMGRNAIHSNLGKLVLDKWDQKVFYVIHKMLYYKSMLYTYLIEKISILKHGHPDPFMFYPYKPYPKFLKNFDKILSFCKSNDIDVAYVCQVVSCDGNFQKCIDLIKGNANISKADVRGRETARLFKLQEIVKEISKERGAGFIDPRLEFYEKCNTSEKHFFSYNNVGDIHLTPLGNSVLAEIISKKLQL